MYSKFMTREITNRNYIVAVYDAGEEVVLPKYMEDSNFYSVSGKPNYKVALDRGYVLYTRVKWPNNEKIDRCVRIDEHMSCIPKATVIGETYLVKDSKLVDSIVKKYGLYVNNWKEIDFWDANYCKNSGIPIYTKEIRKTKNGYKRLMKVGVAYTDERMDELFLDYLSNRSHDKHASKEERAEFREAIKDYKESIKRKQAERKQWLSNTDSLDALFSDNN